jgi:hypothetical protein
MTQATSKRAFCFVLLLVVVASTGHAHAGFLAMNDAYMSVGNEFFPGLSSQTLPEPSGVFAQVFNTGSRFTGGYAITSLGANLSVTGSPYTLQVTADAAATYPCFVPNNPNGNYSLALWTEELFKIQGVLAPGDDVVYSAQGGNSLPAYVLPTYSGEISKPGAFSLSFFAQGPFVYLNAGDPQGDVFDLEQGMGFTLSIEHINPTQTTSLEFLDPVESFASSVPEPSTLLLVGIGTVALIGHGSRRRKLAAT